MLKPSKSGISLFLRPKSIVYKLFSHRYLLVVVIIATSQMILQLWLESRSLVVHRQGVDLLSKILQTRNQPSPISEPSRNEVTSATQPRRRSVKYEASQYESEGMYPSNALLLTTRTLARRDGEKNENQTAASVPSPRLSPSPQSPPQLAGATTPSDPTPQPPNPSIQTPPETESTGRGIKKAKPEERTKSKRKNLRKSTQRPLTDAEKDPQAIDILKQVQLQDGDASTIQTADVAAPGAAIFVLDGNLINLSAKCVTALKQPMEHICRDHRTDIARIVFQVWLWSLTIWGLLLESVPHLAAVAVSHFISLTFSSLALRKSLILKDKFTSVVINECDGVDVLPNFWGLLIKLTIVSMAFVTATALAFTFLGFKLYSVLDWRNFKKLGASRIVRIAHTLSSIFAAILQLNAYFVTVFLALWLDEVVKHNWHMGSEIFEKKFAFKVTAAILLALSIPWLLVGNYSLKNEKLIGIVSFLIFDVVLLVFTVYLLCANFYQKMARTWVFLNFTGIIACILMFASLLTAAACLIVFDRGLLAKVNRDSAAPSNTSPKPEMDIHEVAFPHHHFTEFPDQGSLQDFSTAQRGSGSIISQPQAIHNPTNHQYELESSLSWVTGDEKRWIATGNNNSLKHHSNASQYTVSSGEVSYATTSYSHSPAGLKK